jgi:hypothetical protein
MTDRDASFVSFKRSYRPWGQVRRKNLMSRLIRILSLSILGLAVLAVTVLLVVFAASVAVVGAAALALFTLGAFIARKPARIFIKTQEPRDDVKSGGKGLYEARKTGSTWSVY